MASEQTSGDLENVNSDNRSEVYLKKFENYLKKRVSLITKPYHPVVARTVENRPKPEDIKKSVLQNPRFNNYLDKIAIDQQDRDKKVFEALQILSEIGYDRSFFVIRGLGSIIDKIMAQIYDAVYVNEQSVFDLKRSMGHQQIIYLPSHRSYVDFMLMSYICFSYDLEIPCIAAGMDFHSMMGLGELLRKTGAFFMRRTFGDEFYWNIFREYIHSIMTVNDLGLEFFIEGTRSRSMKSLWPKTGLLTMALDPYFKGELYNVKVVPISISYEMPLEEQLFVYELLGVPKPKESTSGFFKAITVLKDKKYGRVFFDFGKPIDLNEYFGNKLNKFKYSSEPAHIQNLNSDDMQLVTNLAHHVVREQQKMIVLMIFNLMALVYTEQVFIGMAKKQTVLDLAKRVLRVKSILEAFGAIVSVNRNNVVDEIHSAVSLHSNIMKIINGRVELKNLTLASVHTYSEKSLKSGYLLNSHLLSVAASVLSLQLYNNPTLFWLAEPAMVVLVLLKGNPLKEDELKRAVRKLRQIFVYEFVMHPDFESKDFDETLKKLIEQNIVLKDCENRLECNMKCDCIYFLLSAISPFLSSFLYATCILLEHFCHRSFTEKEIFQKIQSSFENEIMKEQNFSIHPYSLCLESITTTLLSLCSQGCVTKEKRDSIAFYRVEQDALKSLKDYVNILNQKLNFEYNYFETIPLSKM